MRTEYSARIRFIAVALLVLFFVLAARLWQLQILSGREFKTASLENRLRIEKLPSPRGIIRDRNGIPLVRNSAYFYAALLPEMLGAADLDAIADFLSLEPAELRETVRNHKEPFEPVRLKGGLTREEVTWIETRISDYPGLVITMEQTRHYLYGEVGAHVLGYLGKLSPSQIRKADFKKVPMTAFIGQWGIEKMFDDFLRGEPGERVVEVDALGRPLRLLKKEPPQKGHDVLLSIDLNLQKTAEEAFGDRMGALAAIRPSTGEVLALVSKPSFDPNLFSRGIDYSDWLGLADDPKFPLLNRALQSQFPPGSTFKLMTAVAALETGAITPHQRETCTGAVRKGRWLFRCWRRGGHGTLALHRAIVESCDVYFYRAGEAAGIDAIATFARQFGFERPSGLNLVKEKTGLIPDTEWKRRTRNQPWYPGETLIAAIGQGYVLVTPIQLARMAAAIGNGGYVYDLRLTLPDDPPDPAWKVPVSDKTLNIIRDAIGGVVSEPKGTGWAARSSVVDIGGKTGTAQVISQRNEDYNEEKLPKKLRDHAWFVAIAPVENPAIAVAVFVENGGHGGEAAAPIAKQAIEAYMGSLESNGKLPAPASPAPAPSGTSAPPPDSTENSFAEPTQAEEKAPEANPEEKTAPAEKADPDGVDPASAGGVVEAGETKPAAPPFPTPEPLTEEETPALSEEDR